MNDLTTGGWTVDWRVLPIGLIVLGIVGIVSLISKGLAAVIRKKAYREALALLTKNKKPRLQVYAPITEGEVLTRLLGAPGSPLYAAILVVVDEETTALLNEATKDSDIPEMKLRHLLGGAAALTHFKEVLEDRIEEAQEREKATERRQSANKTEDGG